MPTRHTSRPKVPRSVREPQMLDAAVRVFAERGYHGASMADIAAGAGVTKPMVYAYFGSKDELYLRCIDHATERLLAAFDIAPDDDESPEETLWRRILSYFTFVGEHRDEWLVARRQAVASGGPFSERIQKARSRAVKLVVGQLEEALGGAVPPAARRELEPLAEAIVGAGEALADWWVDHPEESAEAMAQREMNFVWLGLRGLVGGERWSPRQVASSA
jgi:AcrR family transcriptional regulator